MANTEGISDEDMFKLLTLDGDSQKQSSRGLLQRQRMMDEFELDGHSQPSARVVKASKPPPIKSSKVAKMYTESESDLNLLAHPKAVSKNQDDVENMNMDNKAPYKSVLSAVLKSNIVTERQIYASSESDPPKKISLFKMKRQQEAVIDIPVSQAGFPSFDFPIGSMARRNITGMKASASSKTNTNIDVANENLSEADRMIAGMSNKDIRDSVAEIESVLSNETISFLKNRNKKTNQTKTDSAKKGSESNKTSLQPPASISKMKKDPVGTKEDISDILSKVSNEKELDEVYEKMMGSALADMNDTASESELEDACKLLRSTSPRQRLLGTKTVHSLLKNRFLEVSKDGLNFPMEEVQTAYPTLLPVALRCLLDVSSIHKNLELITYTVQSISMLVLLFSDHYHRIDCFRLVELSEIEPSLIYQCDYMQDAVPLPSASELFAENEDTSMESRDLGNGMYATNSTSATAETDALSFYKDPSWTLLSKMRIIPCLSRILGTLKNLPLEAVKELKFFFPDLFTSVCSILSVLCLRSPGAAVAIAQNKIIIPTLSHFGLTPGADENLCVDTTLALPIIFFLSVLARQSRVSADAISFVLQDVICIFTINSESKEEVELKRWSVVLWRTLLRYGIGISHLSTILQISIPTLSSSTSDDYSLASDYWSAYSVICEYVRCISFNQALDMSSDSVIQSAVDRESLILSGIWFSTHAHSCSEYLMTCSSSNLKLMASMLHFLSAYFAASSPKYINSMTDIDLARHIPVISLDQVLRALHKVLESDVFPDALRNVFNDLHQNHKAHATACAYVEAFMNAFVIVGEKVDLISSNRENSKLSEDSETAFIELEKMLLRIIVCDFSTIFRTSDNEPESLRKHSMARSRWTISAQGAVIKFLCSSIPLLVLEEKKTNIGLVSCIQSAAIEILGRFQVGQEASAAILLSQDSVFAVLDEDNMLYRKASFTSAIQNIMIDQLCSSQKCKEQLDHSFKLFGRPGILSDKSYFNLESLRQDVDRVSNISNDSDDLVLPFGHKWIWKFLASLSSTTYLKEDTANVTHVMIETIKYLKYAERVRMAFTTSVSAGYKLYYLFNCLLSRESCLRNDDIQAQYLELLNLYSRQFFQSETVSGKEFILACCAHSKHFVEKSKKFKKDDQFDVVLELFFGDKNLSSNEMELSSKDLKAVDEFICDLSNAFIEYGAQYDFFTQSIRLLLAPGMSVRVRNRLVDNLKDAPHLLTTQAEASDETNVLLKETLSLFLRGGHRVIDNSSREYSIYLDNLISVLSKLGMDQKIRSGFFYDMAVGTIARELAAFAVKCACGVTSMKHKLSKIDSLIWSDISRVATECQRLKCKNSVELAKVVIDCCTHDNEVDNCDDFDTVVEKIVLMM